MLKILIYSETHFNKHFFLATYSTGFATSCQVCSAGYKCPNRQSIEQCPTGTYSSNSGK